MNKALRYVCHLLAIFPLAAGQSGPRYNVYSLPPFEIKLDVDLWTTVLNGSYLNVRRLESLDALYVKNDDGSNSQEENDPAYALAELKATLMQATKHKDDSTSAHLPSYLLELLTEYTNSYLTTFLHSALNTDMRSDKGWSLVHAIDLRGEWVDVDFWKSEVHYVDGESRALNEAEESFASLTVAFSGTAAVLQGKNVDGVVVDQKDPLTTSPTIDRSLLRLAINTAFSPPDGPYQYLSHVITNSMEDRLYSVANVQAEKTQVMEHDAALVLSAVRDVQTRMDLDLFPTAEFFSADAAYVAADSEKVEKRESITVFLQGCYLVLFIGGFYIYASYRYRRNYLKWELERYGNKDAILFKHKYKRARGQRFVNFISGRQWNRSKDGHSPVTVEIDGVDGFFERELSGIDSSDDDIYDLEMVEERNSSEYCEEPQDLEKGLRESYNESTRHKKGLDMKPIDEKSITSANRSTMKAMDDDMPHNAASVSSQQPKVDWEEVLENVVPIPASDAVAKLDDRNATYHIANQNGTGIIVQRRYVQPASPFDVLYGAAFLHGEADRVEAQRRLERPKKKKIRASPSGRMRKKKKKTLTMKLVTEAMNGQRSKDAIKPMMTIVECEGGIQEVFNEEEEDAYDSDEQENSEAGPDLAQFTPGELRHNPSPMSFYSPGNFLRNLSEKYNLGLVDQSAERATAFEKVGVGSDEKKDCDVYADYPVEDGVVFCDFPRQDGTPCIIYDTKDKQDSEENAKDHVAEFSIDSEQQQSLCDEVSFFLSSRV
jgi:hypothetical protein